MSKGVPSSYLSSPAVGIESPVWASILLNLCTPRGGGGLLVSYVHRCVNKKTMRKGTFFELDSAQRCHYFILSFRVGKMLFLKEKGILFTILQKVAEVRGYNQYAL